MAGKSSQLQRKKSSGAIYDDQHVHLVIIILNNIEYLYIYKKRLFGREFGRELAQASDYSIIFCYRQIAFQRIVGFWHGVIVVL